MQVYRNDRFDTTNFAMIVGGRRICGRDERDGVWHRHPPNDPDAHDESLEGKREITLNAFWAEALAVIDELELLL